MVDNLEEAEAFTCRANLLDKSMSRGLIFPVESLKKINQLNELKK